MPERNGPEEIVAQRLDELEPRRVFCDGHGLLGWVNTAQTRLPPLDDYAADWDVKAPRETKRFTRRRGRGTAPVRA